MITHCREGNHAGLGAIRGRDRGVARTVYSDMLYEKCLFKYNLTRNCRSIFRMRFANVIKTNLQRCQFRPI